MVRTGVVLVGALLLFGACGGKASSVGAAGQGGTSGGAGVDAGQGATSGGAGGVDAGSAQLCQKFASGFCGDYGQAPDESDVCLPQCTTDAQCAAGQICVRQHCRQPCTAAPIPHYSGAGGVAGADAGTNDADAGYLAYCHLQQGECPGDLRCVREDGGSQRLYCACAIICANGNTCDGLCVY